MTAQQKRRALLKKAGVFDYTVTAHHGDIAKIRAFAKELREVRAFAPRFIAQEDTK